MTLIVLFSFQQKFRSGRIILCFSLGPVLLSLTVPLYKKRWNVELQLDNLSSSTLQRHRFFFQQARVQVWMLKSDSIGAPIYPVQDRLANRRASLCWRLDDTAPDAGRGSSTMVSVSADTAAKAASTSWRFSGLLIDDMIMKNGNLPKTKKKKCYTIPTANACPGSLPKGSLVLRAHDPSSWQRTARPAAAPKELEKPWRCQPNLALRLDLVSTPLGPGSKPTCCASAGSSGIARLESLAALGTLGPT